MIIADIVKVFLPAIASFCLGVAITPVLTHYLYKNQMWKKRAGKVDLSGAATPIFNSIHKEKEVGTPRMGGIVIWLSATVTILGIWIVSYFLPSDLSVKLDFLSRNQTWLPLFTLVAGALVGLVDDFLEIKGNGGHVAGGLSLKKRLVVVLFISLIVGMWFFFKLDVSGIGLPGGGEFELGWLFIPFFALVTAAVYSGGIIDGIDGLSGGVFATMFAAYAGIAFYQQQIDLAAFCLTIVGSILAFLWFNIPPARFYMSETGTMGLTITLSVVAFMTDKLGGGYGIVTLPIIAIPLVLTTLSVIIQVVSKKMRGGKKIFLVAPVHHHLEAVGWPGYKVTMRYWVFGVVFAILGVILAIIG
jgi:phospho-N-acetylmuramoyl-pentapeptide-transferase